MLPLFLYPIVFLLSSYTYASVSEVALSDHALRLAILKYNPNHQKPLVIEGPHHRAMMNFLQEALKRFPQLTDLPFYSAENRYLKLSITLATDGTAKRSKEIQTLIRVADRLQKNCPYELENTSNESRLSARIQKTTTITKKAIFGTTLSPSGLQCRHPLIAKARQLGLHELEWSHFEDGNTQVITMSFNSPFAQDLEYVAKALLMDDKSINPEEKAILEMMRPAPLGRQNDYYESLILHHPSAEFSENIEVEFIDRWERSGVSYTHHYFIRGTLVSDSEHAFKIELVREWGPQRPK
ncbi:MAG: hypothetical protein HYV97_00515 [Bdellovibrio sp.]|nr:hypothetical protein [Bdellovibrio sp.]